MSLKLAVVGGGEGSLKALSALRGDSLIDVRAVLCQSTELVELVPFDIRVGTFPAILSRPDIAAVYIATPNDTHVPLALAALAARKHVLVEKPVGVCTADVQRLAAISRPGSPVLGVAFKKRFSGAVRSLLRDVSVGPQTQIRYIWHVPEPATLWRTRAPESGGGVLLDLGSHVFDLCEFLMGEIVEIHAIDVSEVQGRHQSFKVKLRFDSKAVASLDLGWGGGKYEQTIVAEDGRSTVRIERQVKGDDIVVVERAGKRAESLFSRSSEYSKLFRAFHGAIAGHATALPTIAAGLRNAQLIDAAHCSARTGRAVCTEW